MKIVKCSCSNYIHIFSVSDNITCFICGNSVNTKKAINYSFDSNFAILNDKLAEIDGLISKSKFDEAKKIINEILEKAPGPKMDKLINTGEIYWRKLLADIGCINDQELLDNGKSLQQYSVYNNALKYATENEKQVYILINKLKDNVLAYIKAQLKKQEIKEKKDTQAVQLLNDYRNELEIHQKETQNKIKQLDEIKRNLHEHSIDYNIFIGEFKYSINAIHSKMLKVGNRTDQISIEERDSWLEQIQILLSQSQQENDNFLKMNSNNEYYKECSSLELKQKTIISDINKSISQINNVYKKIGQLLDDLNNITSEFNKAISCLEDGNYNPSIKLITKAIFEKIIKKVTESK